MKTVKIGVTGGEGFLGSAFIRSLKYKHDIEVSACKREYWSDDEQLKNWVKSLDVLVHLAGKNRSNDPEEITSVNMGLTSQLIKALEITQSKPSVIFSSSIQEHRENVYGESKRQARELWHQWAERNQANFAGLLIPNLFGPFGKPFYNSVVATFCHQIIIGENPKIEMDAELPLIYVDECVDQIVHWIFREDRFNINQTINHTFSVKVSDILSQLKFFKDQYMEAGEMPALDSKWELYLFATFQSYLPLEKFFPFSLKLNTDQRGSFVEIIRLSSGGQVSFSTTVPEIVRGNHFHTRKMERFAVIKGKAKIAMRKVDEDGVKEFFLDGKSPSFVDMPVWHTHLIQNVGDEELLTMFWINEHYNPNDPDTYFVNVY